MTEIATSPASASYVRGAGGLLADVAEAATATADLRSVLPRLAELCLEATEADRVSFFLLDDSRSHLVLWAVAGQRRNDDLWNRGMAMSPIAIEDVPGFRELFDRDEPVAIVDGFRSPLVPAEWAEAFALASLIAAPLRLGAEGLGLLVVDYRHPRELPDEIVARVGAIARASALAVGNARLSEQLAERAAGLRNLLSATQALLAAASVGEMAERVGDAIVEVLGADHLSVHLLDDSQVRFRTLVQRGVALPLEGTVRGLPLRAAARVAAAWRRGTPAPVVLDDLDRSVRDRDWPIPSALGCVLVLPLTRGTGGVFGFVLAGLDRTRRPGAITLELAEALASHVAFAVERAHLVEQVSVGAELACALLGLSGVHEAGAEGALARLRDAVPPAVGFSIVDVYLPTPGRGRKPGSPVQRQLWRTWRQRRNRPAPVANGGDVYAPIWGRDRTLGVVQARPVRLELAQHQRDQLEAVASALGELIERHRAEATMLLRDRELAMAREQSQAVSELHALVGSILEGVEAAADGLADDPSGPTASDTVRRIRLLTHAARAELSERAASLEAIAYNPGGLEATLAALVARLSQRLDAAADLEVRGKPRDLPVEVEQTLIRVLHEAFARVEQGARASAIAVRLEFEPGGVQLVVRDDGLALVRRDGRPARPGPHFGIRVIQQRVEALGGRLAVERAGPRGLLLRARVPA